MLESENSTTPKEVAFLLQKSERMIRLLCQKGKIQAVRDYEGSRWRITDPRYVPAPKTQHGTECK